jgi:hypothetical protein
MRLEMVIAGKTTKVLDPICPRRSFTVGTLLTV